MTRNGGVPGGKENTGIPPATLRDKEGRLPHQRPGPRERLESVQKYQKLSLFYLFDIGFQYRLAHRLQNVDALRTHIDRIATNVTEDDRTAARIADIQASAASKIGNLATKHAIDQTRARLKAATQTALMKLGQGTSRA